MARPKLAASTYVALLRGINVGGKNLLPMKALADMFRDEGATDVSTFIASGNVIFDAAPKLAAGLAPRIERRIAADFDLRVPVVLRSAAELATAVAKNPFVARGADENQLFVMFLADAPAAQATRALDPKRSPPDEFALVGRDLYLRLPNGAARTKLTNAYFDKALATVGTARNWRTTRKLLELATR
jgi:uncharacterized protein (DUF1697 family)